MIRFDGISYHYKQETPTAPPSGVDNISFNLPAGSFHFLCGPSGAGKTTLFRMMYLDIMPQKGFLSLFGKNVHRLDSDGIAATRRQMGIVFQDFRLMNHLTVRENVELPLTLHGIPTKAQQQAVDDILDWVGLTPKKHLYPKTLSGGEQQRAAIARAVVNRPKILIADEPTGNVDPAMGRRIMHLFCELHKHGTTVLVATHDKSIIQAFNFPVLHVAGGKLDVTKGLLKEEKVEKAS